MTVGKGLEFGMAPEYRTPGFDVVPVQVQIGPSRIEFSHGQDRGSFWSAKFNGYVLRFETECALFDSVPLSPPYPTNLRHRHLPDGLGTVIAACCMARNMPWEAPMKPLIALLPLLLLATPVLADTCTVPEGAGRPINHANLFVEDNAGDGDIGVHGYFDDHGWTELCVFDPEGTLILRVLPEGRMGDLGIAGVFFESREPEYAEWDYAALKKSWPEGDYALRASGSDGELLTGAAWFTTVLPSIPQIVSPATVPEPEDLPLPVVPVADLTVEWQPVTTSQDGRPLKIRAYQVWVNKENHQDDHGFSRPNFDIHVGPGITSVVVPALFFDPASVYEVEVVAIEESGNQTIGGASYFATE